MFDSCALACVVAVAADALPISRPRIGRSEAIVMAEARRAREAGAVLWGPRVSAGNGVSWRRVWRALHEGDMGWRLTISFGFAWTLGGMVGMGGRLAMRWRMVVRAAVAPWFIRCGSSLWLWILGESVYVRVCQLLGVCVCICF